MSLFQSARKEFCVWRRTFFEDLGVHILEFKSAYFKSLYKHGQFKTKQKKIIIFNLGVHILEFKSTYFKSLYKYGQLKIKHLILYYRCQEVMDSPAEFGQLANDPPLRRVRRNSCLMILLGG